MEEAEYFLIHLDEAKDHIDNLAAPLTDYGVQYTIIDNPEIKYYSDGDPAYLRFPYAVEFYLPYSENYLGKPYKEILLINEDLDGLDYWYEDTNISVDDAAWFFITPYQRACDVIRQQQNSLYKLEKENQDLKYQINKLETRLMEKGTL